jgi:hypothetical protein
MSIEADRDPTTQHEIIEHKRDLVAQRLARALDALDRKRHEVADVVHDVAALLPSSSRSTVPPAAPAPSGELARSALIGAVAGGAVFALGLVLEHRRRERNRPLKLIQRAWFKYAMPPQPSLFKRLLTEALGSLVSSFAQEAAHGGLQRLLEAHASTEESEALDHEPEGSELSFVTEPVNVDPGSLHPLEATLAPPGIAPPEPIAPLPSPLREFA